MITFRVKYQTDFQPEPVITYFGTKEACEDFIAEQMEIAKKQGVTWKTPPVMEEGKALGEP